MRGPRRILFAGGGTGGHIYPATALADDLSRAGWECLFLGTDRPAERRIMEKSPFRHVPLPTAYLRKSLRGAARFGVRMTAALGLAVHQAVRFRPRVCVGLGGYGSVPGVAACRALGVPVALFEPNSVAGKANRLLEPLAREIWTWFPAAARGFRDPGKVVRTGIPLRRTFRRSPTAGERRGRLGVLVLGGSQGARGLNRLMSSSLTALSGLRDSVRIAHLTGPGFEAAARRAYRTAGLPAHVRGYAHGIHEWYGRADVVVCRAGAGTLAEVTALGLPAVLVPHPGSPDRHQHRNADYLETAGAGVVVHEEEGDEEAFGEELTRLLGDRARLGRMGKAARAIAEPRAHGNVLKRVYQLAEER